MKSDYAYASQKKGKKLIINKNLLPFIIKLNGGFYINTRFCGVGGWERVYQLNFWNFNLK